MISHRRILQTTASSLQPSLLPVQHCLVTFTVPDELRSLLRACPKQGCDAIFAAGSVTYKYTPSGAKTTKTRTVDGVKFVRGFLQHALPKSFLKVRYYGWMASSSRTTRDRVKWLVWLLLGWTFWLGSGVAPQPDRFVTKRSPCEHCGGELHLIAITDGMGGFAVSRHQTASSGGKDSPKVWAELRSVKVGAKQFAIRR